MHLTACSEVPVCSAYVELLAKSYRDNVDLFKANELQVYATIERLISVNYVKSTDFLVSYVIVKHMDLVADAEQLFRTCIRLCSLVHPDSREQFCQVVLSPLIYEFGRKKFSKKLAPLLFDLVIAIIELRVVAAPQWAYRLLNRSDFYPWKDLTVPLTHLVQSCVAYDTLVSTSYSSPLDQLEDILNLIQERAKVTVTIFRATHETSLKAVLKWLMIINEQTGQAYSSHVFRMGAQLLNLIDEQHVTVDTCFQLLDILKTHLDEEVNHHYENFIRVSTFASTQRQLFIDCFCRSRP